MDIAAFKLLFSLASFSELLVDFEEPIRLLAPPDDESSSFRFAFCKLEPRSLDDDEDVDEVDVVDEDEFGFVASSKFDVFCLPFGEC